MSHFPLVLFGCLPKIRNRICSVFYNYSSFKFIWWFRRLIVLLKSILKGLSNTLHCGMDHSFCSSDIHDLMFKSTPANDEVQITMNTLCSDLAGDNIYKYIWIVILCETYNV